MTLFTVKDEHPAAVKAAIGEILPQWHDAFRVLLEIPVERDLEGASWEGLAVRNAIFQVRYFVVRSCDERRDSRSAVFRRHSK